MTAGPERTGEPEGLPDAALDEEASAVTHPFDVAALERYLAGRLAGFAGGLAVRQFRGGQSNPTYLLRDRGGRAWVLRRKPPGPLLPSAHAIEREHRVLAALAGTGVPVPRPWLLCEDAAVIGTAFFVMDHVPGRVFRHPSLPGLGPAERAALYAEAVDVLARLHQVDWQSLGLGDFGRPGSYFARQVHRWTGQYRASETEAIEPMERLIAWLPAHLPADDTTALVHGDYRIGNLVVVPGGRGIRAVLDWELSTLGHPLADLAYFCVPFRLTPEAFEGLRGLDLAALGLPDEAAVVAAYCRRTGRPGIAHWEFYVAFALFRLAAILQGIMGRVRAGTANDPRARERGLRARPLAEAAWAVVAGAG